MNPFDLLRQNLGSRLFGAAGMQGQQAGGYMQSRGMFDPNLAQANQNMFFQQAIQALTGGLTDLAGQEAGFLEGQRQFDLNLDLQNRQLDWQRQMFNAKPKFNAFDWITGIGGMLPGVGGIMQGMAMLNRYSNPQSGGGGGYI